MYETSGGAAGITRFVYDGERLIAEYNSSGTLLRRYVHGPGVDEPIVWYEGASVSTNRRFLHSNHQGSIIAYTNNTGVTQETETYDPFGVPGASYTTRFQYTGQTMIPELGLYNYKARFYNQNIGRFMQVDPIGYEDQSNLYGYVSNDPINYSDTTGETTCVDKNCEWSSIDTDLNADGKTDVTFKNDNPNKPDPPNKLATETAKTLESVLKASGIESVNINSTTGGEHGANSLHDDGNAVDIDHVNGAPVTDKNEGAKNLQAAAKKQEGIRENFGPFMNEKTVKTYDQKTGAKGWKTVDKASKVGGKHKTHIHFSSR